MQKRPQTIFTTVRSEGAILPADLLARIATLDPHLQGLTPDSYYLLKSEKLNEAINRSWNRLLSAWGAFICALFALSSLLRGSLDASAVMMLGALVLVGWAAWLAHRQH